MAFFVWDDMELLVNEDGFGQIQWTCRGHNELEMCHNSLDTLLDWAQEKRDEFVEPPPEDTILTFTHSRRAYEMFYSDAMNLYHAKNDIKPFLIIPDYSDDYGSSPGSSGFESESA